MGWQDRDYYRTGGAGDYLSNPAAILGLSVPFGTWLGVRVRLHFWLLLTIAITIFGLFRGMPPVLIGGEIALLLAALLLHDFGHRAFARWVGGQHDEFMLWPAGGMIFPSVPPGAGPMFAGHVGGIAVNAAITLGCGVAFWSLTRLVLPLPWNPLVALGGSVMGGYLEGAAVPPLLMWLAIFATINWGIVLINLLPYYWFDGGFLLQSILWPFLGAYQAINITCLLGMILAVPMFALTLTGGSLLAMIFWVLLFSSSFSKRRELIASGTGEWEAAIAYSAQDTRPARRKWKQSGWAQVAAKRAAKARREQEKIDAILEKVSARGMHSLTWWEKRTLRKGTETRRRQGGGDRD
jgi:hypothetical protein